MTSRIPPQNLEAEKAVLGAMLVEPRVIPELASVLKSEDFYFPSHRQIYGTILALCDRGQPVDLLTVDADLKRDSKNDYILAADIAAMAENALPSHAAAHALLVKDASRKRNLLTLVKKTEEDIFASSDDCLTIAGSLSSALSSSQSNGFRDCAHHVSDVAVKTIKQIETAYEQKNPVVGVPTGLADLDMRLGGIHRGELDVIAGRPSMGKSALALTIAKHAAENNYPVVFVTAESPAPKVVQRLLAEASGIENRNLSRGRLSDDDIRRVITEAEWIGKLPLWFVQNERSWDRIKAIVRTMKLRQPNLSLIILDYVGLLSAPVAEGRRYLEIGRISSEAKGLAIELDVGVVLLSQLNREVEGRNDKRPQLSDLRESGCLEQDADVVGLLYREAYYDELAQPRDLAELNIAKNRDGATGMVELRFQEETTSFGDWA